MEVDQFCNGNPLILILLIVELYTLYSYLKAIVKIPYDTYVKQVLAYGRKTLVECSVVLILPKGFELAVGLANNKEAHFLKYPNYVGKMYHV